jgi:WD40 repeat protein
MTLHAWDVETGAAAKGLPRLPTDARALGYSADGREALLLHKQMEIVRWDLERGKELGRYPRPEGECSTAALTGGRLLVPRFDGKAVAMWDVTQNKQLWEVETTRHKNYPGQPVAFSADGRLFAVEAPATTVSVYESLTGKLIRRFPGDADKIYYSLSISPDGRTVAGSNWDGSVRLWDVGNGRERARIPTIQGHVTHVYFAPDSKSFATGGGNNAHGVLLWDTATGRPIEPFAGHTSPVSSVSFSPDGRTVATSSSMRHDAVVRLWDLQTGRPLRELTTPEGGGVSAVAFSPDGKTLAACGWTGKHSLRLWDVGTGRVRHALAGHEAGCTCVAFSPDGTRVATGDAYHNRGQAEGRVCIWDVVAGKRLREIKGTPGAIVRVLFTADGKHVLVAANGVHVYEADSGRLVGEPLQAAGGAWGLALSPDGRLLATAGGKGPFRLWELATRREIPLTVPGGASSDVAFAPDGRTLAFSDPKGEVVLFHWPSGKTVGKVGNDGTANTRIAFSADGLRLATTDREDSSVLLWDVAGLVNRPPPAVAKPSREDLHVWWADLRDDNPGLAYQAVWRFAAVPEQALPFLADVLRPAKVPEKMGPEQLRAVRAVAALEQIGGPEARRFLEDLAAGAAGARLTAEAKGALQRLKRAGR